MKVSEFSFHTKCMFEHLPVKTGSNNSSSLILQYYYYYYYLYDYTKNILAVSQNGWDSINYRNNKSYNQNLN